MKKITYMALLLIVSALSYAQIPDLHWQKVLGGTNQDSAYGITQLTDGNYIMAGIAASTNGDVEDNNGADDIWIVKLSPQGDVIWKTTFGGTWNDWVEFVTPTTDGGFIITGSTTSFNGDIPLPNPPDKNALVVKFDTNGNVVWAKNIIGLNGQSITQTSDGGYLVAGERYSPGFNVSYDALIVKLNANGTTAWEQTYGGPGLNADVAWRIKETSDGNYIFGGSSIAGNNSMVVGQGGQDVWIVKINTTGAVLWQKLYGTTYFDDFNDIVETPDGGFLVLAGTYGSGGNKSESFGSYDTWLLKLDAQGSLLWEKSYGNETDNRGSALYRTPQGTYMIGGRTEPLTDVITFFYPGDFWIFEVAENGDLLNEKTYGGNNSDFLFTFYQTSDNGYLLAGWSYSDNEYVDGNHSNQNDAWVIKLGDSDPLTVCAEGNTAPFNLTNQTAVLQQSLPDATITYYTTPTDADAGTNAIASPQAFTNTTNPQVIYARVQVSPTKWQINHFTLQIAPAPVLPTLPNLQLCGTTTAIFNLTVQNAALLQSQPGATINYYTSQADADTATNAIAAPQSFTNTTSPQTVFVRVDVAGGGCYATTQFDLQIVPAPVPPQVPNLSACDTGTQDGFTAFNLSQQDASLLQGQANAVVSYYTGLADADAATNAIATPQSYTSTANPQTIYVRVQDTNTGCFGTTSFSLITLPAPVAVQAPALQLCDTDVQDGFTSFNLSQQDTVLLQGQANVTIAYYTSQADADIATNAIANTQSFINTTNPQTIYARVSNGNGCYVVSNFSLQVIDVPFLDDLQLIGCAPFNLTDAVSGLSGLEFDYYATEADAQQAVNAIANPQSYNGTIAFVRAQNTQGCSAVSPITITTGNCDIQKGISPNGDDLNDNFDLTYLKVHKLSIYNRYGMQVYNKNNYTDEWYGQTDDNKDLPTGTYYYVIEPESGNSKTGWIYINRQIN
ncbi:T9SS type B sorting domain-containing protein [Flavobacterium zepuense]|uniref:T9SS type B sorting domain-containing protein n=1 Tax=Flavobacterium zepuense TaxID=2593302 RepID=A0A552UVI3_9FLAO|nr:gliding motility-associated C-terminal domain-containing protein [Flavobacterium zepuense]TRW22209.1 T9SS type B sorting domain-containing protein [Flavobacterium zepuense]